MKNLTITELENVLRAYAAGDSFGVAYEFAEHVGEIDPNILQAKDGWPYGGVSDDTLLSLLTIDSLDCESIVLSQEGFLKALHSSVPVLRGLGPTTRFALGLPVKENELGQVGISNGALMRTALLGLAFKDSEAQARRNFVRAMAAATHKNPIAIGCAIIGSALFADAQSNGDENPIFGVAAREAAALEVEIDLADWVEPLRTGISNESTATLNAVLWTVKSSGSARAALKESCQLGGDTDTVAALSTALVVARKREASGFTSIPWLNQIDWKEISTLSRSAEHLFQSYLHMKAIS